MISLWQLRVLCVSAVKKMTEAEALPQRHRGHGVTQSRCSQITLFPNGIIDISINLKCCLAKGMPMMVMVSNIPQKI